MDNPLKGRGTQTTVSNDFIKNSLVTDHIEAIDEALFIERPITELFYENAAKVVNKVQSPDVGIEYSLNPYQGCEHGCIYCYARKTHEYWGYNLGLDFETKIIIKKNAPQLLETHLLQPLGRPGPSYSRAILTVINLLKKNWPLPVNCSKYLPNTGIQ